MDLSPAVAENNRLLVEEQRINKSLERELAQSDLRMKRLLREARALKVLSSSSYRQERRSAGSVKRLIEATVEEMPEQFTSKEIAERLPDLGLHTVSGILLRMATRGKIQLIGEPGRRGRPSIYRKLPEDQFFEVAR